MAEPTRTYLAALLADARRIWADRMPPEAIVIAMAVTFGDIARQVRDHSEGKPVDPGELPKELGNMILSTIRWADDLGFDIDRCLSSAFESQRRYVGARGVAGRPLMASSYETDRLRREIARLERQLGEEVDRRDAAEEWADKLAHAIAGTDVIGEHSNVNSPWANALAIAESRGVAAEPKEHGDG